jgi:ABC-type Fe3+/spermidine/putrescine transport system ATPase subunit
MAAVVEPDGVGTELARVVVGLEPARGGYIHVGRADVTHRPPGQRNIGYVPAGGALLPHLTVRQNIDYGLHRRRDAVRYEDSQTMAHLVSELQLGHLLDVRPHRLTDTQRLRVALARAAVCLPEALVVDLPEPDAGAEALADLVQRAAPENSAGMAVLVCAGSAAAAAGIVDRAPVAVAGDGR